MRAGVLIVLLGGLAASCGPAGEVGMHFAFKHQALVCTIDGLEARLTVLGLAPDACNVKINPDDDTLTGLCPRIPIGDRRTFRLEYYVVLPDLHNVQTEVQLAVIVQQLDLTNVKSGPVVLDLTNVTPDTSEDSDGDNDTNIMDVCSGRNPLDPNG